MASKSSARNEALSMLSGLYSRGEEVVGVFLEELGRNPKVREQLGKTVERAVHAKRQVDRNMQTILSALNVPSRADYSRLLAKLDALQGSLTNLSIKLDRVIAQQQQKPAELASATRRRATPRRRSKTSA